MKLKPFTEQLRVKREPAPTVVMDYRNGRIHFNARTVEMLDLKAGTPISFFQDEDSPQDWYFALKELPGCHYLKPSGASQALRAVSGPLVRALLRSRKLYDNQTFIIGPVKDGYYPIKSPI